MKTIQKVCLLFTMLFVMAVASANAQSMKIVVDSKGEPVGRYIKTNETSYTVCIQDNCEITKKGHRVVTYRAVDGKGIVYRNYNVKGNINVRKGPSTKTRVVAQIPECDGIPDVFDCLGKVKGWYKIKINGKVGYVKGNLMSWDGMCTF